jgi:hypothetical protein
MSGRSGGTSGTEIRAVFGLNFKGGTEKETETYMGRCSAVMRPVTDCGGQGGISDGKRSAVCLGEAGCNFPALRVPAEEGKSKEEVRGLRIQFTESG